MIMKAVESKLKKEKNHGKRKGKNDGERMSQFHGPLSCNGNWPSSARREKQAVNKGSPKNCSAGFTLTAVCLLSGGDERRRPPPYAQLTQGFVAPFAGDGDENPPHPVWPRPFSPLPALPN